MISDNYFCRPAKVIDATHLPYHESDHVLAQVLNLYVGGTCIEDVAHLQHSEAARRIIGACRIPDPTTAGDFLRRFHEKEHQLPGLRRAVDEVQAEVWRRLRRGRGRRDEAWSIADVDGHVKPLYGVQKEGADFYKSSVPTAQDLAARLIAANYLERARDLGDPRQ